MSSNKTSEASKALLANESNATAPIVDVAVKPEKSNKALLICFISMIFVGLGNRIMNIVMFKPMANYPLFTNLLTTLAYLPTSLMYIIPMIKKRPDIITPEARAVPQKVWLIMGTLDSIAGVMQSLAVSYLNTEGSLVVLLLQSAIPSSMLITKLFLKTKYQMYQYLGALLVIIGIVVDLVPSMIKEGGNGAETIGIWAAVLVLSCIPMCLSSVYKEKALGDTEIDAIYMNYWVAVYQFILSFPLLIPSGYASGVAPNQLVSNIVNGAKCYIGTNSIVGGSQPDDCSTAPLFVNLYILFNLAYNVLIILMLKYGSSNILWLCLTLQVPIANFVFAFDFMPNHKPVGIENVFGLIVIMGGLVIYRFYNPIKNTINRCLGYKQVPTDEVTKVFTDGDVETAPMSDSTTNASPNIGGATPMLGPRAHRTKTKKSAVERGQERTALKQQMRGD